MSDEPQLSVESVYREENMRTLYIPDTFYGLLEAIRQQPGWYIGLKSLWAFHNWLAGYRFGQLQMDGNLPSDIEEFDGFDDFVCKKYRWHDSGGWAAKIAYYHRDDADAFDEFFKLLDEFREIKKQKLKPRRKHD